VPRAIIDTQSSRPAYVRRRIGQAIIVVFLVALVAAGLYFYLHHAFIPGNPPG
jgi:hypothetical protein